MSASRLRNTLSALHRNKETWPNPELSIGTFCGTTKDKVNYWEAQGPAREAFVNISTSIQETLNDECLRVPSSSTLVYDVYMIGKTPGKAVPHIMFSCKASESRKKAVALVRKSDILDHYPGMELGHWESPPHLLSV
ncbi:uncharacterized protein DSM5745_08534 [Aspergillus mulundensis]|uniref:Uncharacterized protein n=1 Tax=Aspergillus mulundensis TaxID=1810919 RepID=A0A3D8R4N0_9EURO|nr:hypothetical protein DSM5745_08534 [Aspergillus mulundensis]RDW68774.1 hypothetical protein DSM5745_08534 [Aspergillus mulundensis]